MSHPTGNSTALSEGAATCWSSVELRQLASREAAAVRLFQWLLACYTAILISKVHELYEPVARMQPAKIVGAGLLLSTLVILRPRSVVAVMKSSPAKSAGVIAALAALSTPGAVWPGYSFAFLTQVFWKTLAFFAIAATAWCDRRTLRSSIIALVLSTSVVALVLLVGKAPAMAGRLYVGVSLDPNESALQLLVVIPFGLYLAWQRGRWRVIGIAAALLMVAAMVRTGSRAGLLGLIVLGLWLLYRSRPRRRVLSLVAVAAGAMVVAVTASDAVKERFSSILHPTTDYNFTDREGRVEVWKRGLGYITQHPFLGVGVQNFPIAEGVLGGKRNEGYGIKYSAAHNAFLQVGAELGVLGLIAFVRMLWTAASRCRRVRRAARLMLRDWAAIADSEANLAEAALTALVLLVVGSCFLSVAYDPVTFFVVAVCIAVQHGSPLQPAALRAASAVAPAGPRTR